MLLRLVMAVSAICFFVGATGMALGATIAWMACIVSVALDWGPLPAFVALFGTPFTLIPLERYVKAPWQWWYEFWVYCDRLAWERLR